jgi:hypothetical protein
MMKLVPSFPVNRGLSLRVLHLCVCVLIMVYIQGLELQTSIDFVQYYQSSVVKGMCNYHWVTVHEQQRSVT